MRERAEQSGDAARILEHLEQFAVSEVAASILEQSLERAGVRSPPSDAVGLGLFVCGPLRDVAEAALGAERASAIVEALSPLYEADVALARSGIRGKRPKQAQTARTVLVASPRPTRAAESGWRPGCGATRGCTWPATSSGSCSWPRRTSRSRSPS